MTDEKVSPSGVSIEDLSTALSKIKKTNTPWINGISPALVINAIRHSGNLFKLVLIMLQKSFSEGALPESMTMDLVIFLLKSGAVSDPGNFRPISVDNPFTKIACQVFNDKVMHHLDDYMSDTQFAYTENKSTHAAILRLGRIIEEIRKRGNYALVLATDCSGAFETIQQELITAVLREKFRDSADFKAADWATHYLLSKKLFAKDESSGLLMVRRVKRNVGSGQGSKSSPYFWIIQSSSAIFTLDQEKGAFLTEVFGEDLLQVVFADDNIAVLETQLAILGNISAIRFTVNVFLTRWNDILCRNGMILNKKKTEVLCLVDDDSLYPPLKTSIKWLGILLGLNKNGFLSGLVDRNIKYVQAKTMGRFSELLQYTTSYAVKLKVFQIYMEPVLSYILVICILEKSGYECAVERLQITQNIFLRKIAGVGTNARIDDLHKILGVKKIASKLTSFAENEWNKLPLDLTHGHKLCYTRSHRGEGSPIIESTTDCLAVVRARQSDESVTTFCLKKFNNWRLKTVSEMARINGERSMRKKMEEEHQARLREIQNAYTTSQVAIGISPTEWLPTGEEMPVSGVDGDNPIPLPTDDVL